MKRVVVLAQVAGWPAPSGMGRRLEAIVDSLRAHHDVHLVSCLPADVPSGVPQGLPSHRLTRPAGGLRAVPRMPLAAAQRLPLASAYYTSAPLKAALRERLVDIAPDLLVVHGVGGAVLAAGLFPRERTILDLADAEHERTGQLGRSLGWRGLPYRLDPKRIVTWLARELPRYRAVTVVSDHDLASYRRICPAAALLLCPNGCQVPPEPRADPGGTRLLFLGDLTYQPNREGLEWFLERVLPTVPGARLRAVGRGDRVSAVPLFEHAGFVADLQAEWGAAIGLVVPLFSGGGTRVKILEAMAAGVPIVSTTFGASGLELVPERHILLADTDVTMRNQITRLLGDLSVRRTLSSNAHALARDRYQWGSCLQPMVDAVSSA